MEFSQYLRIRERTYSSAEPGLVGVAIAASTDRSCADEVVAKAQAKNIDKGRLQSLDHDGKAADTSRQRSLSQTIADRIRSRTSGRVQELRVECDQNRIIIQGRCATFYTKQLAQHAAMGVLEDELLVNDIRVGVMRG